MPKRIMPPGARPGVGDRDLVAHPGELVGGRQAAGPAPTISTRLPVGVAAGGTVQPCLMASSPRKRSTELMPTALSSCARLQAVSQGR